MMYLYGVLAASNAYFAAFPVVSSLAPGNAVISVTLVIMMLIEE